MHLCNGSPVERGCPCRTADDMPWQTPAWRWRMHAPGAARHSCMGMEMCQRICLALPPCPLLVHHAEMLLCRASASVLPLGWPAAHRGAPCCHPRFLWLPGSVFTDAWYNIGAEGQQFVSSCVRDLPVCCTRACKSVLADNPMRQSERWSHILLIG